MDLSSSPENIILIKYLSILRRFSCSSQVNYSIFILKTGIIDSILGFIKPEFAPFEQLQIETTWLVQNLMKENCNFLEISLEAEKVINAFIDVFNYSNNKNFQEVFLKLVK